MTNTVAPRPSVWKRICFRAGALCGGMLLCLALLYGYELYLGWSDPRRGLGFDGVTNGHYITWGHVVVNNRLGFRGHDFVTPKPPGTKRVMLLGDSLTWGAGLAVEQRYGDIVEARLNATFHDATFEVLNFAVSGGPTIKERDILRKYGAMVDPDLIVVGFCLNDPQPKTEGWSQEREDFAAVAARRTRPVSSVLRALSLNRVERRLFNGWGSLIFQVGEWRGWFPTWMDALDRVYRPDSHEWKDFVGALRDIKAISDQAGIPPPILTVLNQGTSANRSTEYADPSKDPILSRYHLRWIDQVLKAANSEGFYAYDHRYEIAARLPNSVLAVNAADGHPSASVNLVYADKLFDAIVLQLGLGAESGEDSRSPLR